MHVIPSFLRRLAERAHRRRACDTALHILRRIRVPENLGPNTEETQKRALAYQLSALEYFVRKEQLLDGPYTRQGQRPISNLLLAVDVLTPNATTGSVSATLDQIDAMLEIEKMHLGGRASATSHPSTLQSSAPPSTAIPLTNPTAAPRDEASQNPSATPTQSKELQPAEINFLWTSAERLYNSWPFRFLGLLMLAAVLLAGAGTFFIGGQTLQ
jgi:hypothetical protein